MLDPAAIEQVNELRARSSSDGHFTGRDHRIGEAPANTLNETGDRILELGINSLVGNLCTFLISSDGGFDGNATCV